MRSVRLPTRRHRVVALVALVATVALLSALATPWLDALPDHSDRVSRVSHHAAERDAAHAAPSSVRTSNRVGPGAAVLPMLALAVALALVASLRSVRRRRFHVTTWRLQWSRGPPTGARTAAATFA